MVCGVALPIAISAGVICGVIVTGAAVVDVVHAEWDGLSRHLP